MQNLFISSQRLFILRCFFFLTTLECVSINRYIAYKQNHPLPSYVYLTNWGLMITFLYFGLAILDQIYHLQRYEQFKFTIETIFKISMSLQFMISVPTWMFLYPVITKQYQDNRILFILNLQTHSLQYIFLWIDNIFNLVKVKRNDYIIGFIFGTVYGVFNMIVGKVTGIHVYDEITYQEPHEILLVMVFYWFIYVSHFITRWFYIKYKKQRINKVLFNDNENLEEMYINMNSENRVNNS